MSDRRQTLDRRSNWRDALIKLELQDKFLLELDELLESWQGEDGMDSIDCKFQIQQLKEKYVRIGRG